MPLPIGLVYDAAGHVILDPDTAIQGAVRHLLATFEAAGSATAVVKAFRAAGLTFPWRHRKGPRKGEVDWQPLRHSTVLHVLHNPRYAGAFTYGRHREQPLPGRKRGSSITVPRQEWISFIPGAHPGYITLDQWEANIARLAANAAAHGRDRAAGPPREGPALLQGIIICGRCGGRMTIRYHARGGKDLPTYLCQRDGIDNARPICTAIPGHTLDEHVGQLLIDTLTPLAVEAALQVSAELRQRAAEADALRAAHVERARYHADLARRRYLAVDPANRLVAGTLEADWNTALRALDDAQAAYDKAREQHHGQLTEAQKDRIAQLVTDLPGIWNDPATPTRERKRIARLLLTDVTVTRTSDTITAHVRLAGGQARTLTLPVPEPAWKIRQAKPATIAEIDKLLDHHTTAEIAAILQSRGLANGEGRPYNLTMVQRVIRTYHLRSRRQRLLDAGLIPLSQMAELLGVSPAPSRSGTTPELSAGSGITTKAKSSTTRPDPTRQPATKDADTTPSDLHERHLATNRSEEVQYATRGFIRGAWTAVRDDPDARGRKTASNAAVNLPSRSRIRNLTPRPAPRGPSAGCGPAGRSRPPVGWAVTPPRVHAAGAVLDERPGRRQAWSQRRCPRGRSRRARIGGLGLRNCASRTPPGGAPDRCRRP